MEIDNFDRTGIVLYTIRYRECVAFYRDVLGLKIMFDNNNLTCFHWGEAYLMVEIDDEDSHGVNSTRTKFCLRMNVSDIQDWLNRLNKCNVSVDYQEHSWGKVAKFADPDGNLCAFKDSQTFEKQIQGIR